MSKLHDLVAFGEAQEATPCAGRERALRSLRAAMRWVLAIALLGFAFSGAMTFREYASPEPVCAPLGPNGSALAWPPCVYGLLLCAALVLIASMALARTRGGVGDELVDTSL